MTTESCSSRMNKCSETPSPIESCALWPCQMEDRMDCSLFPASLLVNTLEATGDGGSRTGEIVVTRAPKHGSLAHRPKGNATASLPLHSARALDVI